MEDQVSDCNVFVALQSIIQMLIGCDEIRGVFAKCDQFAYERMTLHSLQMLNNGQFMTKTQCVLVFLTYVFITHVLYFARINAGQNNPLGLFHCQ